MFNRILATCGTLASGASVTIDCSNFIDVFNDPATMTTAKILYVQCTAGSLDIGADNFWFFPGGVISLTAVSDFVFDSAGTGSVVPAGGSFALTAGANGATYNVVVIGGA
jgi:hypothetical protein